MLYKLVIIVHILGAAVLVGTNLVLLLSVIPKAKKENDLGVVRGFLGGVGQMGVHALAVQLITGLWLASPQFKGISAAFQSREVFATHVVAKIVIMVVITALVVVMRRKIAPKLSMETLGGFTSTVGIITLLGITMVALGVGLRTGGLW
ncbi:MAG: hypothetical protein HYU52_06560 [Acidobacteria bacterium]|nr:hypothetical protein [Acidobacteriota bacterium]